MITSLPALIVEQILPVGFLRLATAIPTRFSVPQSWPLLLQAGPAPGKPPTLPELVLQYAPLLFVVLFAWLLLYRPERQRQLDAQRLRDAIKRNDRVITTAGIYGIVAAVDRENDRVSLKVDETNNVKMDVTLASIGRVLGGAADPGKQTHTQD